MACHALRHDEARCGREIIGGGLQCWVLDLSPLEALKIKETQVKNEDLLPRISTPP
jgi:hypothetical protein